jgi:hypothetical protein
MYPEFGHIGFKVICTVLGFSVAKSLAQISYSMTRIADSRSTYDQTEKYLERIAKSQDNMDR